MENNLASETLKEVNDNGETPVKSLKDCIEALSEDVKGKILAQHLYGEPHICFQKTDELSLLVI